ncbi:LOW QUALITY PROTEIN: ABC transporter, ATP-binding/permease protein [Geomicrobium sp. JCM 19037]|nr:LOW QUALITY PROTEIN: ABC transporter, ATP-binding/permease protein [Geomicrobium sp. JCM 19037]
MTTGKRLIRYALNQKRMIIWALLMLTIAVAAELAGPFIAKHVIDRHLTGIEDPWYESVEFDHSVAFGDSYYTREVYLPNGAPRDEEVQILQIGTRFFFTEDRLPTTGERNYNDGTLSVEYNYTTYTSEAIELGASDVLAFYSPEVTHIVRWLLLYLGLIVFASFFQYGQSFYLKKSAHLIVRQMRNDVFQHLSKLPVRFFDHHPAGKIVARVTNDTEAVRELYMTVLATFFSGIVYLTGIYIALFILDVRLALLTLVLIPLFYAWIQLYHRFAAGLNRRIRDKNADINAAMNENIHGMSIIQAFNQESSSQKQFEQFNNEHYRAQTKLLNLNSLTSHNLTFVLKNILFTGLIWTISGGGGGIFSIGVLYAFVDLVNRLFEPLSQMVSQLAKLEQARAAGQRVFELMDEQGEALSDDTIIRPKGDVQFDHVHFSYEKEKRVLKDLTFQAKAGQTIALVGHTGSGKSSIMNLLFRFYDPDDGTITIDGLNTKDMSSGALREHMGIVLQEPYLFTGTVAENISYGRPEASRDEVKRVVRLVGGETIIGRFLTNLSPNVEPRCRVASGNSSALLVALLVDPAILVLDEATSNVDTETEAHIQQGMNALKNGRTTFVIAHRLSTIIDADQILVLDRGQIVERGTHDVLLKRNGTYRRMYELQQGTDAS